MEAWGVTGRRRLTKLSTGGGRLLTRTRQLGHFQPLSAVRSPEEGLNNDINPRETQKKRWGRGLETEA